MKILPYFLLIFGFLLVSCGGDDDICTNGEATPRIKMKFKAPSGKLMKPDSLYISVDYGDGEKSVTAVKSPDSVLLPIRVDDANFTDIFVKTTKNGSKSKIKLTYTTENQYVSPACGIKKNYKNFDAQLVTPTPVISVEKVQTNISDENKTSLYLHF